jgi:hypothetical protein
MGTKFFKWMLGFFLASIPVFSLDLDQLTRVIEDAAQRNSSLSISELFSPEKQLRSLSPSIKEELLKISLSKLALKSENSNLVIFQGSYTIQSQPFLIEIRAFGEGLGTPKSPPSSLVKSAQHQEQFQTILKRFPDNDALSNNPVMNLDKIPGKKEIHHIVGDIQPVSAMPLSQIQPRNQQERSYINRYLEAQKLLPLTPREPPYLIENGDKELFKSLNYSLMMALPSNLVFSIVDKFDPRLAKTIKMLNLEETVLLFSTAHYYHPDLKRDIWPGLNIIGSIRINGIKKEPLASSIRLIDNYVNLSELDYLNVYGLILPEINGSTFTIEIPGTMQIGKKARTKALQLRLEIVDDKIPLIVSLKTGIVINIPRQDPLELLGSLNFSPPSLFSVAGELPGTWKNPFGLPYLELQDVAMEIGTDFEVVAASEGAIPITDLGGRATMRLDFGSLDLAFFISLTEDERILIYGNFIGKISLKNLADLSLKMHLEDKNPVSATLINKFKENIKAKIPDLTLREAEVFISPAHQIVAHKEYHKGMSIKAKIDIWDDHINFESKVSPKGIYALAYIPAFHIGPLTIKGPKFMSDTTNDIYDLASVSKISSSSGPIIYLNVDSAAGQADFFIDGQIEARILNGISADTRIYFSKDSARFSLKEKVGDAFLAELNFSTDNHDNSRDLKLDGLFEKSSLNLLEYKLRAMQSGTHNSILARVFSHVQDIFDFTKISFKADFDGMNENKLILDIDFSVLKKEFSVKNLSLDFDNLEYSLREIASRISKKIGRHVSI